ncbi:thiamine phosphate synthase [Candidatus Omnitrophota bacterium]
MKSKKQLLLNSRIYLLLDKQSCKGGDVVNTFVKAEKAGVDIVQLRQGCTDDREFLNDAKKLKKICSKKNKLFFINNRLDIALLVNADGLHLGQADLPLTDARKILGKNKIIGISCSTLRQAKIAELQGADYIGLGPLFPTLTKPGRKPINPLLIKNVVRNIQIPFFAIGGINPENMKKVLSYDAKSVAICRAVCRARNIPKAVSDLRKLIN